MICEKCHGNQFVRVDDQTIKACDCVTSTAARREQICLEAIDLICNDRATQYGDAQENFSKIADLWSVALEKQVTATDVSICLALLKVARLVQNSKHSDSWRDAIGYLSLGAEISDA
jgi:hypothetical protein